MEFKEAKEEFILAWGTLGSSWGINKAMAQIHALLLISPDSLGTDEIMEELNISRGNANTNIRALLDWGIIRKEYKSGERREFFASEKDVWKLARQVTQERRRREIEPILRLLADTQSVSGGKKEEVKEFKKVTKSLYDFSSKMDVMLERFVKSDEKWFTRILMKLIK